MSADPGLEPETLQVFFAHATVIAEFRQWVTSHGWELRLMPRFDENDDTYIPTHMIVPKDLARLLREQR